jgi:histidinol phosphatase-like enzyme
VELRAWLALSAGDATALRAASATDLVLVFAWEEGASAEEVAARAQGAAARTSFDVVDVAVCTHGGGPPTCWCRPPLPGLIVPWLRNHEIAPSRSTLLGSHASHLAMAKALGFSVAKKA